VNLVYSRDAYERYMKLAINGIPSPTAMWRLTALSTGALRFAGVEDVMLRPLPSDATATYLGRVYGRHAKYVSDVGKLVLEAWGLA